MRNRLALITLAVAASVGSVVASAHSADATVTRPVVKQSAHPSWAPFGMKSCKSEDAIHCYWDATKQGNGKGASFYSVIMSKRTVCYTYPAKPALSGCEAR